MSLKTPQSLSAEHEVLHADLAKAIEAGGATGKAAKGVDCVLHPHFLKEEEVLYPASILIGEYLKIKRQ